MMSSLNNEEKTMNKILFMVMTAILFGVHVVQSGGHTASGQENLKTALRKVLVDESIDINVKTELTRTLLPFLHPDQIDKPLQILIVRNTNLGDRTAVEKLIEESIPQKTEPFKDRFIKTVDQNAAGIGRAIKQGAKVGGQAFTNEQRDAMAKALEAAAATFK